MELKDYLRIFRTHWLGSVILVMLAVAAAAAFNVQQPKVYSANASGFVSAGASSDASLASVGDSLAKSRVISYVDLAKSRSVAKGVAKSMNLSIDPASLIGRISVEQPPDTVLLRITARESSPIGAQRLADAWVSALADEVQSVESPKGSGVSTLSLVPVESAELPSVPSSPNVPLNLALGLAVGLLLGAAYALIRSQLDRRLNSPEDVESRFQVAVAGAIPISPFLQRDSGRVALLVADRSLVSTSASFVREAFLKLRTNLQYMNVDNPTRVVVVTSPLPGDGKSTVAANLAEALAAAGGSVVLIDGDLRRPVVAESFGLVSGVGLTDVLAGQLTVEEALQEVSEIHNLHVLSAGRIPPNPSELLGSESMARLLAKLTESSTVVIDAPPLLPVTDAAVLTAISDGALIVISSRKTLDTQLRDSIHLIEKVQGKSLGVVFNRVTKRDANSGYYGGYYGYQPRRKADPGGKPTSKDKPKRRSKRTDTAVDVLGHADVPAARPTSRRP